MLEGPRRNQHPLPQQPTAEPPPACTRGLGNAGARGLGRKGPGLRGAPSCLKGAGQLAAVLSENPRPAVVEPPARRRGLSRVLGMVNPGYSLLTRPGEGQWEQHRGSRDSPMRGA